MRPLKPSAGSFCFAIVPLLFVVLSPPTAWALPERAMAFNAAGVVLGPDGKPVAGATVAVATDTPGALPWPVPPKPGVRTDANGRFAIAGERPAPAAMADAAAGVEQEKFALHAAVAAPGLGLASVVLQEGENTVRLQRGRSLSGIVKNPKGVAVAGANVGVRSVWPDDPASYDTSIQMESYPAVASLFRVRTGTDGRWTLGGLPMVGNVSYVLDDPRFVSVYQSVPLSDQRGDVPAMVAKTGAAITGKVVFPDGKPAPEIVVTSGVTYSGAYARDTTDAEGKYTLNSLPAGEHNIRAKVPTGEWVTAGVDKVAARSGQPATAPDITLGRGMPMEGIVVDGETDEPLAGAVITLQGPYGAIRSTVSDAKGRYTVRALPGSIQILVPVVPGGYIPSRYSEGITIGESQKSIPPRRLFKGVTLRGTAVDEAGKPALGAVIRFGQSFYSSQARVDDDGTWVARDIWPDGGNFDPTQPAGLKLIAGGEWQVVRPASLQTVTAGPVEVVLRRIRLLTFEGRVVTPAGAPIPDAAVKIKVAFDADNPDYAQAIRPRTTDADGRFRLSQLRPESAVSFTVSKPGYVLVSGGRVVRKANEWSVEDVVMASLQAQVTGRVVDTKGAPEPGALVSCIGVPGRVGAPVRADAQGRFVLRSLPEGQVTIIAAHGRGFGQMKATAGREAQVVINRAREAKSEDVERAATLIAQWIREDDERARTAPPARTQWWADQARYTALQLAPYDPDLALRLVTGADGTVNSRILSEVISQLARRNPKLAATWAPVHLDKIDEEYPYTSGRIELALAVTEVDPALARRLMESEATALKPKDFSQTAATRFAYLAGLAAKLKDPRAGLWLDALQVALEQMGTSDRDIASRGIYASLVAQGSPELAEKLVLAMEPAVQMRALETLIPNMVRRDPARARRLLATMEALAARLEAGGAEQKNDRVVRLTPRESLDRVYEATTRALARIEPEAALEIARKIGGGKPNSPERALAIANAARYLKGEAAAKLFREAAATPPEYWRGDTTSEIAAMAYRHDPALGEELFAIARKNLAPRLEMITEDEQRPSYATYAFLRAAIDPAESRLLLETEWARRKSDYERAKTDPTATRYSYAGSRMARIVHAMVAIDLERALQMLRELTAYQDHDGGFADVRPLIVSYLLASADARRTMRFEAYVRDDE